MKKSKLIEHKLNKKTLITPFNQYLGNMVTFKIWQSRLPDLLWLAVIIYKYGHIEGLGKCYRIIEFMKKNSINVENLKITNILNLDASQKEVLFDYINVICEDKILDCLCLVIDDKLFRNKFYKISNTSNYRIKILKEIIDECYSKYSYLGCDIRFFFAYHLAFNGKLKLFKGSLTEQALKEYPLTEHSNPIMELYRSDIRTLELSFSMMNENLEYANNFWKKVSCFSECELYYINFEKGNEYKMNEFYNDVNKELQNLISSNFDIKNEEKFIVITGLFTYAVKILNDVCDNNLHNTISSRILLRTIVDVFLNIKYLIFLEKEKPNVWKEFQDYGLGKFKLIYKKSEEKYNINEKSHLTPKILEAIVNDGFNEETMDIDLGYFDRTSIIKKFEDIGEKELYDTLYDYDISYSHAHWGAIRESSMLKCDNTLHQLHISSDASNQQISKSTEFDYITIFIKLMKVISTQYNGISDEFFRKYEVHEIEENN